MGRTWLVLGAVLLARADDSAWASGGEVSDVGGWWSGQCAAESLDFVVLGSETGRSQRLELFEVVEGGVALSDPFLEFGVLCF